MCHSFIVSAVAKIHHRDIIKTNPSWRIIPLVRVDDCAPRGVMWGDAWRPEVAPPKVPFPLYPTCVPAPAKFCAVRVAEGDESLGAANSVAMFRDS